MGHCDEGECSTNCGCGTSGDECCGGKSCCDSDMTDMVMSLADHAWAELMKEKIKQELEKKRGPKMDKIAAAAVDASITHWDLKAENKAELEQKLEKLRAALKD